MERILAKYGVLQCGLTLVGAGDSDSISARAIFILILIAGLGLAAATAIVLLPVFVVPFNNFDLGKREDVRLCKAVIEHILYVAEGYEQIGILLLEALAIATSQVSETYDVEGGNLDRCLDVLDDTGYSREDFKPRPLR